MKGKFHSTRPAALLATFSYISPQASRMLAYNWLELVTSFEEDLHP
jgi:hypothetical protein